MQESIKLCLVRFAIVLMTVVAVSGCGVFTKQHARTALDVARVLCELQAVEDAEKQGIDAGEVIANACATEEQLRPFYELWLSAQAQAVKNGTMSGSGPAMCTPEGEAPE